MMKNLLLLLLRLGLWWLLLVNSRCWSSFGTCCWWPDYQWNSGCWYKEGFSRVPWTRSLLFQFSEPWCFGSERALRVSEKRETFNFFFFFLASCYSPLSKNRNKKNKSTHWTSFISIYNSGAIFLAICHHKKLFYPFYFLTLQNIQHQWFYFSFQHTKII